MATNWTFSKVQISAFLIVLLALILFLTSLLIENIFNTKEINTLVNKANEQNLDYELIIHNPLTSSYSFSIKE